ncbi:Nmad2 family putative nucleotide modification protein [Allorhodopirellula solitaria]|uniref:Nucleotide modification associated domain-containing protein n=1 Tax=Allorhodopirellula solitaria TaxID=2527987 RepID=A0A5C5YGW5_9BACT|nr:hypothetical protein [Allorhodopirellula solitaria]TWT73861.1 hypothetical protein CA85_07420 [Allorhodopirellula solitaria]
MSGLSANYQTSNDSLSGRCYVYKVVVDNGGAPCVYRNVLSLAICKPAIRRTANAGDLIFGFSGNADSPRNRLVYIAEVTERLVDGDYYYDAKYAKRPDCIYDWAGNHRLVLRDGAKYHNFTDARVRDVGQHPEYANACVLLSSDFRYFDDTGNNDWKRDFGGVAALVENMGQGHRVNHGPKLRDELLDLKDEVWRAHSTRKLGTPAHGWCKKVCHSASYDEDELFRVTEAGCEQVTR